MSDDFVKALVLVAVIVYILSPIDGLPGPVDDLIIAVMGVAASRRLS